MFNNGPGVGGSIPDQVIPKTEKMVLDTALLNIQYYKFGIKVKVEQHSLLQLGVVANEKGAIGSPLTMVANFTLCIYI